MNHTVLLPLIRFDSYFISQFNFRLYSKLFNFQFTAIMKLNIINSVILIIRKSRNVIAKLIEEINELYITI